MHSYKSIVATNRFGLGARPGEAAKAAPDPQGWLLAQLEETAEGALPGGGFKSTEQALSEYFAFQSARRKVQKQEKGDEEAIRAAMKDMAKPRGILAQEIAARTRFAVTTEHSFRERLVRFWSNHFTVSVTRNTVVPVAGSFEREAIRPRITGFFQDLLIAAETHPAMLLYLDNAQSVGPNSSGGRRRGRGLNENLAREILELHTVGVRGGYTQEDVTSFARILTGWTIGSPRDSQPTGKTYFDERRHEPGIHAVMGKKYSAEGGEQGLHVLRDLSTRPETARFLALKLARHFISDQPPAEAVEKLAKAFLESAGNLKAVSAELVRLEAAWKEEPAKFKSPDEFHISTLRGLGGDRFQARALRATYETLGQAPFTAPSPEGWPDDSSAWLGPDALKKRLEWSQALAGKVPSRLDPRQFMADSLGASATERSRFMVGGADSMRQGLALALMAPEFQRR